MKYLYFVSVFFLKSWGSPFFYTFLSILRTRSSKKFLSKTLLTHWRKLHIGENYLLYTAVVSILVKSGVDDALPVIMKWVGPDTPPNGIFSVTVNTGKVSTSELKVKFEENDFSGIITHDTLGCTIQDEDNGYICTNNPVVVPDEIDICINAIKFFY